MGLPVVRTGNVALDRFLEQVREFIETSRGGTSPTAAQNRVLRVSDIGSIVQLAAAGAAQMSKSYTQPEMEKFAADLANTRVFQALTGEGSALGDDLATLPRTNITDVKVQKDASGSSVTSDAIVAAEGDRAVAALVTTVQARLDNFDGTASIEEAYLALADATDGLQAQYTVKVTAGGAVAGFGLAASSPTGGTPSSAFIVSADKFAVVSPTYNGGLTNSPSLSNIPFGVDANGVYINGTVRINAGGTAIQDVQGTPGPQGPQGPQGPAGAPGSPGARGATRTVRTISGSAWSDAEANAAIAALGFSPVVRDEVTLRNSDTAPTYVETRYWSGFAWVSVGVTIDGNLLVSGSITSDKIGANELNAVNVNTTGQIRSSGSHSVVGVSGGFKASVQGYNLEAGQIGVAGYGSFGVFGFNQHTDNITGAALRGLTQGNTGVALWIGGRFKWEGSSGTYTILPPDGDTAKFLRADGQWVAPAGGSGGVTSFNGRTGAVSLTHNDVYNATSGQTLNINASTVGGYSAAALVSAMNSAITDNNNNFVTPNFIRRYGTSFTLTIPGVGSWSGCTVT